MKQVVKIRIPDAHSQIQRQIQLAFRTPELQELWVACGTKFGKTVGGTGAFCLDGPILPQATCRWVAPIYKQAVTIGMANVKRILPPKPFTETIKSENCIYIPATGTRLEFWHGQDPESLEGAAGALYVFDEAAKMKEGVYASARTTVTQTRSVGLGKMLGISTPLGRNWFWKKCMEALEEMERAKHEKRRPKKMFLTAPTSANPHIDPTVIEEARKTLPLRLFKQYFMAEFIDDAAVFSGYRACMYGEDIFFTESFQGWLHPDHKEKEVVIGVDWARNVDFTVMIALAESDKGMEMVGFCRFQGRDYVQAIKHLIRLNRQFKDVFINYHDKTGVGVALDDQLGYTDLVYKGINFTNNSKSEMVTKLITTIEQRSISFPKINPLIQELEAYEIKTNALGNMTFSAPEGQHDDTVSALMLAHAAALQYIQGSADVTILEELGSQDDVKSYYDDILDDDFDMPFTTGLN